MDEYYLEDFRYIDKNTDIIEELVQLGLNPIKTFAFVNNLMQRGYIQWNKRD